MRLVSYGADELEEDEEENESHEESEEEEEEDKEDEDVVSLILVALLLHLCTETPHIQLILSSGWHFHCGLMCRKTFA